MNCRPSNLHRRKLCPGSARMEAGFADTDSVYAAEGRMLHALFADKKADRSKLTGAQRDIIERADNVEAQFASEVEVELAGMSHFADYRERRLEFHSEGEVLFPGTPDLLRVYDDAAVIADAKFGYADVDAAETNYQLAAYAVMAAQLTQVAKVYVAIIQPRAPFGQRLTRAVYDGNDIPSVAAAIVQIVAESGATDAPLSPGDIQCRNCRAAQAATCPAFKSEVRTLEAAPRDIGAVVAQMPAEELGHLLDCIKLAASKTFGDVVKAEVKRRVDAGEMPGWKLKPTGANREITSVREAYERFTRQFAEHGRYTSDESTTTIADDFLACLAPKFGDLEELIAKLEGIGDTKAKRRLNEILAGLILRTDKAPSVVREKEAA